VDAITGTDKFPRFKRLTRPDPVIYGVGPTSLDDGASPMTIEARLGQYAASLASVRARHRLGIFASSIVAGAALGAAITVTQATPSPSSKTPTMIAAPHAVAIVESADDDRCADRNSGGRARLPATDR
jgi:hypothetical protein